MTSRPGEQSNIPVESRDDAVLRQLAGAAFLQNPGFRMTLPSGREIGRDEVRAFSELLREPTNRLNLDRPQLSGIGKYLPEHYVLSFHHLDPQEHEAKLIELHEVSELMTPDELYEITDGFIGALNTQAAAICVQTAREQVEAALAIDDVAVADEYSYVATHGEFELTQFRQL